MPNAMGFFDEVDRLTMRPVDVWPTIREDLAFETLARLWPEAVRAAVQRLGEERRRTSRNAYGEGGFNPTLTERRGKER